jgi:hypothetical protein
MAQGVGHRVSEQCQKSVRRMSDGCQKGVRRVSEGCYTAAMARRITEGVRGFQEGCTEGARRVIICTRGEGEGAGEG